MRRRLSVKLTKGCQCIALASFHAPTPQVYPSEVYEICRTPWRRRAFEMCKCIPKDAEAEFELLNPSMGFGFCLKPRGQKNQSGALCFHIDRFAVRSTSCGGAEGATDNGLEISGLVRILVIGILPIWGGYALSLSLCLVPSIEAG